MELIEYEQNQLSPFEEYPQLKNIWPKELQKDAEASIERYNNSTTQGKILLIKVHNEIVGITGYYFTEFENCVGLRWHGVIPSKRGKSFGTKSLELLYSYILKFENKITLIQEFAPFNKPSTIQYFKNIGYIQTEKKPKIYSVMPNIKCYRLVKTL